MAEDTPVQLQVGTLSTIHCAFSSFLLVMFIFSAWHAYWYMLHILALLPQYVHCITARFSSLIEIYAACFLFNWLGFFIVFCCCYSAASRCGAISGIGASFIKIACIIKVFNPLFISRLFHWWSARRITITQAGSAGKMLTMTTISLEPARFHTICGSSFSSSFAVCSRVYDGI